MKKKPSPILFFLLLFFIAFGIFATKIIFSPETRIGIKSKAEQASIVNLKFSPPSVSASNGQEFKVKILARPDKALTVQGYGFDLKFDPAKLEVKSISYLLGTVSINLGDDDNNLVAVNQKGEIKVRGEVQSETGQLVSDIWDSQVLEIAFVSKTGDKITVGILPGSKIEFYDVDPDGRLRVVEGNLTDLIINGGGELLSPTPTSIIDQSPTPPREEVTSTPIPSSTLSPTPTGATGSPTPSLSPSKEMILNFQLRFQGITQKPAEAYNQLKVKLTLVSVGDTVISNLDQPEKTVFNTVFKADNQGVWKGKVSFQGRPGRYKIFAKGPKHIQKELCFNPDKTNLGDYRCSQEAAVQLSQGENDLDFSNLILMVGDLPEQDGLADSLDFALVRNNIGSREEAILKVADVNLDGIIDSQDYALMLIALSIRYDEEIQ